MLKIGKKFFLISILALALPSFGNEIAGSPIGCVSGSGKYSFFELHGKILLNKAFLPSSATQQTAIIEDAIELQTKHLIGYFRNTADSGLNAAISAYRGKLNISPPQEVSYGSSFEIDNYLPTRGLPSSTYTQQALRLGSVKSSDAALLIPYSRELMIADCTETGFLKVAQIKLPLDPYLSFWIEKKARRLPRTFNGKTIPEMSNCFSKELADFGNADTNWFLWDPARCQIDEPMRIYQPELTAFRDAASVPPLNKDFFGELKSFNASAVFGIISKDPFFAKIDMPKLKAAIHKASQACQENPSVPECLTLWSQITISDDPKHPYEPGTYHFLTYLKYLYTIVSVNSFSLEETNAPNDEIVVKFRGRFVDSQMPVSGSAYLGWTNVAYGPHVSKTYVKLLHDAFRDSNAIFYVGHAGLGHNLKIEEFEKLWREDHLPPFQRQKPMWVSIFNCEGFSYFGFDQEGLFKNRLMKLFLTESSGTDAGAKFPLSHLSILNQIYSGRAVDVKNAISPYVRGREFATVTLLKTP